MDENQNQTVAEIAEEIRSKLPNEKEIFDREKVGDALVEIADLLENRGLNLAECAEVGRMLMLWSGFEIAANAKELETKSKSE